MQDRPAYDDVLLDVYDFLEARIRAAEAAGTSAALFAYFWPVLSAAPLDGRDAFQRWTWLDSWR
jgi:hypothetical protein